MVGRPRQFVREEVLDKAIVLFWQQGYEATGVAQLSETLGIGKQSLYGTFGDKRGLYIAAIRRYSDASIGTIRAQLSRPGRAVDHIAELLEEWAVRASEKDYCGCFLANSCSELGTRDPELAALLQRKLTRMSAALQTAIERAQSEGDIAPDTNAQALARALVNTAQGLSTASKVDRSFARDTIGQVRRLLV
jgi:TetR/AcrR family transcriptional repressor of nem operon